MNKYQEALDNINSFTFGWADCSEERKILQELVDKNEHSKLYTKQQLIDELDKVYSIAKQNDNDLKHYADIYRLIERLVE